MAMQPEYLEDGSVPDREAMAKSRKWFHDRAVEAAFRGDPLAGSLMALEHLAEPFFIGLDYDEDDSDFDVLGDSP